MNHAQSGHAQRKADTIRLVGWVNVALSFGLVYFAPERVPAVIAACVWIIAVFAITQAVAWQMGKKDDRLVRLDAD